MGTNFYDIRGRHLAKFVTLAGGKPAVYWAVDPADLHKDAYRHPDELVTNEYGEETTLAEFYEMANKREYAGEFIGQEFS